MDYIIDEYEYLIVDKHQYCSKNNKNYHNNSSEYNYLLNWPCFKVSH